MKPNTLYVSECLWTAEECPLVGQVSIAAQRDSLCLPNLFRSKRAKPFATTGAGPTSQVHRTARELLLELFDRGAIEELSKRLEAGAARPLHSQSKEQADLAEQQYSEFLTWLSVVLEDGLSVGGDAISPSDPLPSLDRWQGVLERSSLLSSSLLSLSRLRDDEDKMEVLSALHAHLSRRSWALCAPGEHLAVKKFSLGVGGGRPPALTLALLCDPSSGFVWNVYLYDPELLRRRKTSSGVPPVKHVLGQLLRPFLGRGHRVHVDGPAGAEGRLARSFSDLGVHLRFAPPLDSATDEKMSSPSSQPPRRRRQTSGIAGHLRGWTGPALLSQADPARGQPRSDVFLPGFWVTVHLACINAFVLHSLQFGEAGGRACDVTAFTKALASQLAGGNGVGLPAPFGPLTGSPEQTLVISAPGQRSANHSSGQVISMEEEEEEEEEGGVSSLGNRGCRKPGVCGLANSGNSCYMNAVLQCLCSTVPLVEYLLGNNTRNELAQRERAVAGAFVRLLDEVWLGRGGTAAACVSGELRATVCSLHPQFDNRSQQDAQELLLLFLNALHDDLKKKGEGRQTRSSSRHGAGESTIVTRLFEGQLSYVTLCMRCDHQAHSSQVFTILSLPIPTDVYKCSLQDCLSLFFQQSTLTAGDRILCPECGVRRDTAVLTSLVRPPEILMLHLKRFGCHGSDKKKLRTNVLFSLDHLDLTPYLSSPSAHHTRYSLYAVVNHTGDLDMGHYTALCHSALLRTWHQFDDASVSEVQDFLVQSPNTYILLYSRQPFRRPQIAGL